MESASRTQVRLQVKNSDKLRLARKPSQAQHDITHPTLTRSSTCPCAICSLLRSVRRGTRALESEKKRKKAALRTLYNTPVSFIQALMAESIKSSFSLIVVSLCVALPITAAFSLGRDEPSPVIDETGYMTQQMVQSAVGPEPPPPPQRRLQPPSDLRITPAPFR
jgi:hypothetical protein